MTFHILPRLRPNHTVQSINDVGTWAAREKQVLEDISKGLHVDKVESEINSIPDMWARPILFEMALFDRHHVLHERILGEWRGLLAMIALKEVAKLDRLTVAQVKVPLITPLPEGEQETDAQQRDFMRTLSKLIPKSTLAGDTSWRNLYAFVFNGKPIGMTSPTTLVATAADYLNRISNQDVAWYNGTYLKDPVGFISPRQKQILGGWLSNLTNQLGVHRSIKNDRWNLVSGLLGDFVEELGDGACSLSQSGLGIQGQEAGFFKYLDKPADGNVQEASHVQLIPSEGRTPARSLLVFDRSIAEQWDMMPQDVTVHGAQTLASSKLEVADAEVWKAADFFTKKLFVIFQENAFPGTTGVGHQSLKLPDGTTSVTPILPLRWELLQYLSVDDLARCVRWEQSPQGLVIHLFLTLSGPGPTGAGGRTIELTKPYSRDDIQTLDSVPILEVWPNFKNPGWKAYYTCYSTDDDSQTFAAKPYADGKSVSSEVPLAGRKRRRFWRTESFPEAMICTGSVPNTKTNQLETVPAGVLLLAEPEQTTNRGRSCKVGLDFGAASTTICVRQGQDADLIKFKKRKVSVTASSDVAQADLFNFFLPPGESDMPLLSFFHNFDNASSGKDLQPFLNGHVYLLPGAGTFDPNQPGMAFDLKWSSNDHDRKMVKAFLGQLCLQTAAELVDLGASKVSWSFSYPTAFSDEQIEGFPKIWEQVTRDCIAVTGLSLTAPNEKETESVATAMYFVKHLGAATAMGAIFIDIGGSTTDISVWQGEGDKGPVWQTSVLLAGRSLFSNYLWRNTDILGVFGVGGQFSEFQRPNKEVSAAFYALTDAVLRYNSDQIFTELPVRSGMPEIKALRQHLAIGVCGLFYYVGSLLQYLLKIGAYKKNIPNVYVGGNGSKIFRWLDIDGEERINALYKAVFSRGAGWADDQPFKVVLSPEPKMEAAYGLVENHILNGREEQSRSVFAGENFISDESLASWVQTIGGDVDEDAREFKWNTVLNREAFTQRLGPSENLERLADFISVFNQFAKQKGIVSTIDASKEQMEEVRRRLGQSLSRYNNAKSAANIIAEPIFIIALRHLLDIRAA